MAFDRDGSLLIWHEVETNKNMLHELIRFDRDGNPRIHDDLTVDCGAFEFQGEIAAGRETPSLDVTMTDDTFDLYDEQVSLREAIWYVDPGEMQGTTITFDNIPDESTITLGGTSLWVDKALTIDASSFTSLTIDADSRSRA